MAHNEGLTAVMAGKVFVNYRRDDSAPHALSIAQYLEREFGARNVFIDIDRMRAGQNFHKVLEQRLSDCSVVLTVIGPSWLDVRNDAGQRRIDDPEDWVRLEMARALARGITTIPVLVGGASLPKKTELPDDLKSLVQHHAAIVTTNGFRSDMAGLVHDIREIIGTSSAWKKTAAGIAVAAIVLAGGAAFYQLGQSGQVANVLGLADGASKQAEETARTIEVRKAADTARADAEAKRLAAAGEEAKAKAELEAKRQAELAAKTKREQAEAAAAQKREQEARAKEAERQRLTAAQAASRPAAPAASIDAAALVTDPVLLKEIRTRLYELNFDPGPIEGGDPALTERAIREFEAQIKVAESGRPTRALVERIRAVPAPHPWGAIVYARAGEKWGMAWGHKTRSEAAARARSSCSDRSGECGIEVSFFGSECAAFAHSEKAWAITARSSISQAKESALSDCGKRGDTCRIIATVCADGSERYGAR